MNYQALINGLSAELAGNGQAQTACNGNPDPTVDMSATTAKLQARATVIQQDIATYSTLVS